MRYASHMYTFHAAIIDHSHAKTQSQQEHVLMLARSSDNSFCSLQLYDTQSHNFSSAKRATDHAPGHRNRASLYRTTAIRLNEDSNLLAVGTASGKRGDCCAMSTLPTTHYSTPKTTCRACARVARCATH